MGEVYTTKLGYEALIGPRLVEEVRWWKKLWKEKAPPKSISLMWLALNNEILAWEMMKKSGKYDLGIFLLFHNNYESTKHLFLYCTFS
jgi:hypothetical protein